MLYNNIEDLTGLQDASFQVIDYDERVVFETLLSGARDIYRLDRSDFANYNKVGGNNSNSLIIDDRSYNFNRLRLNEQIMMEIRFHYETAVMEKKTCIYNI